MNTRFLDAFVWVSRLGSFKAAAAKLNMSQAAISSRIISLEDDLGVLLFDRDRNRLHLTARRGAALLEEAEVLLEADRKLYATSETRNEPVGRIRIGLVESIVHT